jgi:hypothetical protein
MRIRCAVRSERPWRRELLPVNLSLAPEFRTCQNSSVASVSGWGVDEVTLRAAYEHWLNAYHPTDYEIECVDAWLENLKTNGPVGRRVPRTSIVIDYLVDTKERYLWVFDDCAGLERLPAPSRTTRRGSPPQSAQPC